jgi:hypothetical protein
LGKPEGKRPLRRPRHRWVDNIRMDLGEMGWGDVDWIGLAQDRNRWRVVVNSVLNLRVPWNAGKLSSGLTSRGFLSSAQLHRASQLEFSCLTVSTKTISNSKVYKTLHIILVLVHVVMIITSKIYHILSSWCCYLLCLRLLHTVVWIYSTHECGAKEICTPFKQYHYTSQLNILQYATSFFNTNEQKTYLSWAKNKKKIMFPFFIVIT